MQESQWQQIGDLSGLEDCDVSVENLVSNRQAQGSNSKYVERLQNLLKVQARGHDSRSIQSEIGNIQ